MGAAVRVFFSKGGRGGLEKMRGGPLVRVFFVFFLMCKIVPLLLTSIYR